MNGEILSLHHWFDTPPGRYVLEWEQERYDELVADVFGYHALQLGMPKLAGLRANRMPHRWLALGQVEAMILDRQPAADRGNQDPPKDPSEVTALLAEPVMLPFAESSLDLVLMPHSLEDSVDPHAGAFLPGHNPQRLNSAAAAGLLVRINGRQRLVDLDTGKTFRCHSLSELLKHSGRFCLRQFLP